MTHDEYLKSLSPKRRREISKRVKELFFEQMNKIYREIDRATTDAMLEDTENQDNDV